MNEAIINIKGAILSATKINISDSAAAEILKIVIQDAALGKSAMDNIGNIEVISDESSTSIKVTFLNE